MRRPSRCCLSPSLSVVAAAALETLPIRMPRLPRQITCSASPHAEEVCERLGKATLPHIVLLTGEGKAVYGAATGSDADRSLPDLELFVLEHIGGAAEAVAPRLPLIRPGGRMPAPSRQARDEL